MRISLFDIFSHIEDPATDPAVQQAIDWLTVKADRYWFAPSYKSGLWDGTYKFLSPKTNLFPTGLFPHIQKKCEEKGFTLQVNDNRRTVDARTSLTLPTTLRDYQVEAITAALQRTLSVGSTVLPWCRGIIKMPTGSGKTVVLGHLLAQFNPAVPILVLLHRKDLMRQTQDVLTKILEEPIGIIGDAEWSPRRVTIAMVQTLYQHLDEPNTKAFLVRPHVLCSDEAHHLGAAKTFLKVASRCPAPARYAFSATPYKAGDWVQAYRLQGATSTILYETAITDLADAGFLPDVTVVYHQINEPHGIASLSYVDAVYCGIVTNAKRNAHITTLAREAMHSGRRVLLHVNRLEHGEALAQQTGLQFLSGKESTGTRLRAAAQLREGTIRGLIVTTIWQEGVDVPDVDVIILCAGGKSEIDTLQRIGRGMRIKSHGGALVVHDFLDLMHRNLLSHSRERFLTCRKAGFTINCEDAPALPKATTV